MAYVLSRAWRTLAVAALAGTGAALLIGTWTADLAAAKGRRGGKREEATYIRPAGTPVMAVVAINQQRITVYDAEGPMLRSPVSTGKRGYETPPGVYSILQRRRRHYSNIYEGAAMPYMQRITWSGIALHGGRLPGYPASGGCIRLPMGFARRLFKRTKLGMRIIVVRDDISPADIVHPALFQPWSGPVETVTAALSPGGASDGGDQGTTGTANVATDAAPARPRRSLRSIAAAKTAEADAAAKRARDAGRAAAKARVAVRRLARPLRRAKAAKARAERRARRAERRADAAKAETPAAERALEKNGAAQVALAEAQAELEAVEAQVQAARDLAVQRREEAKAALAAKKAAREDAKEAARKLRPVSVFISRKTRRLYVRQAREPLFESPVTIADADSPLGTYVFTAVAYANAETELRWSAISMYRSVRDATDKAKRRRADRRARAAPADLTAAKLALDRIAIPKQAVDRISEIVTPGSSLIVSDEGISRETGKGTGFIVIMSNEPQGGIKIRRRRKPARYRYRPRHHRAPYGWSAPSFWWN